MRTGWDREESELTRAVRERRAQGLPLLDLTASNPTRCGLGADPGFLLGALLPQVAHIATYDPQPFGAHSAREAVAAYYRAHDAAVDLAQVCLTASTSEAYSFLFRLLCDPGDEVLIATPSYPLFEYLAELDDVCLIPYPLLYDHGWQVEPGALAARIGPRTRAIALVHPNNPTGHFVSDEERAALEALCVQHGLALLVDEVFLDYPWTQAHPRSFAQGPHPTLTLVLSGLSKIAALPQMKLSWCAVFGPAQARTEALARLEIIADAFLSVSALPQAAAPAWLAARDLVQTRIRKRVAVNLQSIDTLLKNTPITRLAGEGGWYALLRVPALESDELLALRLLEQAGVLVHPGSAFGLPLQGWLVVSLLPEPASFLQAVTALVKVFESKAFSQQV